MEWRVSVTDQYNEILVHFFAILSELSELVDLVLQLKYISDGHENGMYFILFFEHALVKVY